MYPVNFKSLSMRYLLFLSLHGLLILSESTIFEGVPHRSRRQLLFPNSTLLQFNAGIGTPTPAKMVNLNWAFQANFQLPWNRSQIPVDIFWANSGYDGDSRKKREIQESEEKKKHGDYENDARLYHFYKFVEETLNSFGYNGTTCVLRTLCQLAAEPLHSDDEEDLLYEIANYVLNPTNDIPEAHSEADESHPYKEAYRRGSNGHDCITTYDGCSTTLIDMFTKLHEDVH